MGVLLPALVALTTTSACWAQETSQKFQITSSLTELYGAEKAERFREILDPETRIKWHVYRPAHNGDKPPGALVYVSPTRTRALDGRGAGRRGRLSSSTPVARP